MSMTRRDLAKAASLIALGGNRMNWAAERVVEEDMVVIPGGKCRLGTTRQEAEKLAQRYGCHITWLSGEYPRRIVEVATFAIARYPVTNRQFAAFCKATGYPPRGHWMGPEPPEAILDHPVVMVNLEDCRAYARWAGSRLPTEDEWEKAARGTDGRMFPWGNRFIADACHWNKDEVPPRSPYPNTAPVTAHPKGASPYGIMDLCGNAAEWVEGSPGPGSGIIKGGSWMTQTPMNLRPAARNMSGFANNQSLFVGFRCAKDVR